MHDMCHGVVKCFQVSLSLFSFKQYFILFYDSVPQALGLRAPTPKVPPSPFDFPFGFTMDALHEQAMDMFAALSFTASSGDSRRLH